MNAANDRDSSKMLWPLCLCLFVSPFYLPSSILTSSLRERPQNLLLTSMQKKILHVEIMAR